MANKDITINDFDLFCDTMKSTAKIVDAAKFQVSQNGLEIYGAHGRIARCEIATNAIASKDQIEFSIENLSMFNKILATVKEVHDNDYSSLKFTYDGSNLKFASKKFKTKLTTQVADTISMWISKKIEAVMTPLFEFTMTPELIKRLNSHSFMFSNPKDVRVYIEKQDTMEKNAIFATLGNRNVDIGNEITLKCGVINAGQIPEDKNIIIDFERLNLFNCTQLDTIPVSFTDYNCLLSKQHLEGKNGTFFNLTICSSILKN